MLSVVTSPVVVRAPAKINVHLGVGDLRDDGFHDLETVFQAVSLRDEVRLRPADQLHVTVSGAAASQVPTDNSNLAARAAILLGQRVDRDPAVHIDIAKGIPIAGGMAGGSADAAATLVGLDHMWKLGLERAELYSLAAELGSDVPFCIHGGTALGTGRGEELMPVLARGQFHWVVAVSSAGLSTPEVYRELDTLRANGSDNRAGSSDALIGALASGDPHALAPLLANDLQAAALSMQPLLRRTLRAGVQSGALAGIVSGSGPTCVFLCADSDSAISTAAELSGAGVCKAVRTASGPTAGAQIVSEDEQ